MRLPWTWPLRFSFQNLCKLNKFHQDVTGISHPREQDGRTGWTTWKESASSSDCRWGEGVKIDQMQWLKYGELCSLIISHCSGSHNHTQTGKQPLCYNQWDGVFREWGTGAKPLQSQEMSQQVNITKDKTWVMLCSGSPTLRGAAETSETTELCMLTSFLNDVSLCQFLIDQIDATYKAFIIE